MNFVPKLGDEVEVHKVDDEIIIIKAEEKKDDNVKINIVNGYYGTGILFRILSFTGIPIIIGFIQDVIVLFKMPDVNGRIVV